MVDGQDIVNAVMASAPKHRFWKLVIRIKMRKADTLSIESDGAINLITVTEREITSMIHGDIRAA